jgi:malonyl-CoA/methylmalonyl-CoA synthetase
MLFPPLADPPDRVALVGGGRSLTYEQVAGSASSVAASATGHRRVAVWATPSLTTCVGVAGVLLSDAVAVPINPKIGARDLEHVVRDSEPTAVIAPPEADLPEPVRSLPRIAVDLDAHAAAPPSEPPEEAPAFVFYTSGTTGPPKGVLLPRRALTSNLDALAAVWRWTADDVLTHALPLFHVHGLILGVLGPLRLGGTLRHAGPFSVEAVTGELTKGATMLFGVPTMYHALAAAAEQDAGVARALAGARLLVSGSAPLPVREINRIEAATGRRVIQRYGLTETIMNCAQHADEEGVLGSVGPSLPGVDVELRDDAGARIDASDGETMGEVWIRGPNLFLEYLNRPDATREVVRDGWFRTGDLATREPDGSIRIAGRRATDLIKTGGFKVGAGEVEAALLEHPAVAEAAVTGEPDDRLGERIVAWVVLRDGSATDPPDANDLEDHVAALLAPHKRPRAVRFVDGLPRNEMGKVKKSALRLPDEPS